MWSDIRDMFLNFICSIYPSFASNCPLLTQQAAAIFVCHTEHHLPSGPQPKIYLHGSYLPQRWLGVCVVGGGRLSPRSHSLFTNLHEKIMVKHYNPRKVVLGHRFKVKVTVVTIDAFWNRLTQEISLSNMKTVPQTDKNLQARFKFADKLTNRRTEGPKTTGPH